MGILKAAAVFSDHMVLQRGKPVCIWGVGEEEREITVVCNGKKGTEKVFENKWSVRLEAFEEYGGPYEMTLSDGENRIWFTDVYVGEVYLAGGQSNMELELSACETGEKELANLREEGENVRFYYTEKIAYRDDYFYAKEAATCWETCDSSQAGKWSAVGYYFAKYLAKSLGCKVGVIGCNWGGTSASAWIDRERLLTEDGIASYVEEYEAAMKGKTFEKYLAELREYQEWYAAWQPKIEEFYRENPEGLWDEAQAYAGPSRWPEPMGPKSPFRPGGVYETMLKRVCPYTLAGVLYYQGESDDHKPEWYERLLTMLISQWREDWKEELPFLLVQLPMFLNRGEVDRKNWCMIRQAQERVSKKLPRVSMAVTLDLGEYGNIHPIAKEPVGKRLALLALSDLYGVLEEKEAKAPVFEKAVELWPFGGPFAVEVFFRYGEGMYVDGVKQGCTGEIPLFELAGEDGIFYPATAILTSEGRILVKSDDVLHPRQIRYGWVNYGVVALFGANGIPAAPFAAEVEVATMAI